MVALQCCVRFYCTAKWISRKCKKEGRYMCIYIYIYIYSLKRKGRSLSLSLSPTWGQSEKAAVFKPQRELSSEANHAGSLISDFQPLEQIIFCSSSRPAYDILLWHPKLTETYSEPAPKSSSSPDLSPELHTPPSKCLLTPWCLRHTSNSTCPKWDPDLLPSQLLHSQPCPFFQGLQLCKKTHPEGILDLAFSQSLPIHPTGDPLDPAAFRLYLDSSSVHWVHLTQAVLTVAWRLQPPPNCSPCLGSWPPTVYSQPSSRVNHFRQSKSCPSSAQTQDSHLFWSKANDLAMISPWLAHLQS